MFFFGLEFTLDKSGIITAVPFVIVFLGFFLTIACAVMTFADEPKPGHDSKEVDSRLGCIGFVVGVMMMMTGMLVLLYRL